jgi:flagellar motility protein MotE (MotC chaperone)
VPSIAIPVWLMVAAAAGTNPQAAPRPRDASPPSAPVAPAVKPAPAAAKPAEAKAPVPPHVPAAKPSTAAKTPARADSVPTMIDEPEEEIIADSKSKGHRRAGRKQATAERLDIPERRPSGSPDRYAAVVPPGLTLAALRGQLAKAQVPTLDAAGTPSSEQTSGGTLADIEKAREALRQETARLEALLKASGNCGGTFSGGGGMPIGEGLAPTTPVSATALREAPAEQIDTVSKAMKGMKPEQAAGLVARLDRGLAAEIMRRMKASDAGAILGLLKPELAAELATQIATRKSIYPKDKKGTGK